MLPIVYQKVLQTHLSESQYLTIKLLILLIQTHRQVRLSRLANAFAQPIQYSSRVRSLQRFLLLPQLSAQLLWFPIVKYWLRQEFKRGAMNRAQRRRRKGWVHAQYGFVVVAIDRTEWKGRNLFIASIICGTHAMPLYWQLLPRCGSSDLDQQLKLLKPVLRVLKGCRVVVIADREFHSPKLATWLNEHSTWFVLRQKKSAHIQLYKEQEYKALKTFDFKRGQRYFFERIHSNKHDQLGPFNLVVYWKRPYRGKGPKDPWYLLTNLSSTRQVLALYRARWGIEQMFKDCKSGGYNLEDTKVSDERFLALVLLIAIAYTLASCNGLCCKNYRVYSYVARLKEHHRHYPRHSLFWLGLYGHLWQGAMTLWSELAYALMRLKPQKRLFFQRGLNALSLIPSAL